MDFEQILKKIKAQKIRKFDESVDLIYSLNQEKKQESSFRIDLKIPNQFGQQKKVLVLCEKSEEAKASGADFIGLEEYVEKIKNGWREFDIVIATPTVMPKIAILGKFLGSSGLMPNPKNGTVTNDIQNSINEFKSGKISIKANKANQIQISIGKRSMEDSKLQENIDYVNKAITEALGSNYNNMIKSVYIKSSMGNAYRLM